MRSDARLALTIATGALCVFAAAAPPALAAPDIRVRAEQVTDSRYAGGSRTGGLSVAVRVWGDGMDGVEALRLVVAAARDDTGTRLLEGEGETPDFRDVQGERATALLKLGSPAREAATISLSGRVELFLPSRDPNAVVKVPAAFSRPNRPLSAPGLAASGLAVTPLPRTGLPAHAVSLRGPAADFDRIRSVRILRADGSTLALRGTMRASDGETTLLTIEAEETIPKNAGLVLTVLTERSRDAAPFELKDVPLP